MKKKSIVATAVSQVAIALGVAISASMFAGAYVGVNAAVAVLICTLSITSFAAVLITLATPIDREEP